MSEKFSLKWSDFQSSLSQSFSVLREESDFYDVTLVSDDLTQISAHKLVLSASSQFFKSILKKNPHSHPLLYLSGVDSTSLGFVLDYIYQGEVQIYQDDMVNFLEVAQKLKIEGLTSTEDSKPQPKDYKDVSKSANQEDHVFNVTADTKVPVNFPTVRNVPREKIVSVQDMSEVNLKIEELMEKSNGRYQCQACDYSSDKRFNMKEHVEIHIEGLNYPCQFCDKTYRSKLVLRKHLNAYHK